MLCGGGGVFVMLTYVLSVAKTNSILAWRENWADIRQYTRKEFLLVALGAVLKQNPAKVRHAAAKKIHQKWDMTALCAYS